MAWFCLKHRKSVNTLLKLSLPLAKKIKGNPKIIEHLVQWFEGLVTTITPPKPPPRVALHTTDSPTFTSKQSRREDAMHGPSTSIAIPLSSSRAHRCTLEFITEAAQELYTKGQLHVKPYAGYLRSKCVQASTKDSPL